MTLPVFAAATGMLILYRRQARAESATRGMMEGEVLGGSTASHD
jgi:hypothetical protein